MQPVETGARLEAEANWNHQPLILQAAVKSFWTVVSGGEEPCASVPKHQSCQRETQQSTSSNGDPGRFWSPHVGRVPGEHVLTVS